jgi:Spy/CpxP family protein refolding chaperone
MKTTRVLMLTLLMSIFCVALSYAQQGQRSKPVPKERTAKRIEMMKKSLDLTDEQAVKLQEAQKQLFGYMKQIREKSKTNREEMKTKMTAYNEQLKKILTPEQYQKYQDQRKDMQKNRNKKMQKDPQSGHKKVQAGNHQSKEGAEL